MKTSKTATLTELISDALECSDFKVALNVPGWGGTEVFAELNQSKNLIEHKFVCFNEEAAFSMTTGAALYGARSALLIKAHGLLKCANALTSTLSIGTTAAHLIFVFDDVYGKSSDNILNIRPVLAALEAPIVELTSNAFEEIQNAVQLSEKMKLPVIIYVDCDQIKNHFPYTLNTLAPHTEKLERLPFHHLAAPIVTKFQREVLESKLKHQGTENISLPNITDVGSILPPKLKITYDRYIPFFKIFSLIKKDFVSGDAGTSTLFGFPPFQCIDATSYMGGSPGMAAGAYLAGAKKAWSVTGDFSFFAAGILGLNEALVKYIPIKLVIFANKIAAATGGQVVSEILMTQFFRSFESSITQISIDATEFEIQNSINKLDDSQKLEILVVNC
ncbi:MAG: thiamine pyrophosphate-dependent enzyme [Bacteriovoracaceae bacterium]|nr:thiamine pyrophosphate-dependent enzyme [Bacteriovoracaceae bacterium]